MATTRWINTGTHMPIFDSKGMLKGRRLRKLSPVAHALWPFIFSMASEKYARLEIDAELIADELLHLSDLLPVNEQATETQCVEDILQQFVANDLAFRYEYKGVPWLVFDCHFRRNYASTEDNHSPAPPEPAYTEWLKKLHNDDWESFHPDKVVPDDVKKQKAEAGRKGAMAKWHGKADKDDTVPDFAIKPMAGDGTVPAAASEAATGVRCLVSGSKVLGSNGESNSTVPYRTGAVSHQDDKTLKPEKPTETPEQTEVIKSQAIQIAETFWDPYEELPSENTDISNFEMLLRSNPHITVEDIHGVIMWMLCVNKDSYWLKRMTNSADFVRAFRKMHEQYEKCGGYKVAVAAQRIAQEKADAMQSDGETFAVEDVDETDGLI